jgi:GNAT superfamily N-acetyltransferase
MEAEPGDTRRDRLVVGLLDELAARATAPARVEPLGGWKLRASPDAPFRRANSVLPNGDLPADTTLEGAIDAVERFYEAHRLRTRFQVSPAARPAGLDHALERRGYEIEAPVVVMCAGATIVLGRTRGEGRVTGDRGKRAWERAHAALHGDNQDARERVLAYGRALNAVSTPAAAVVAPPEPGAAVALGFAVAERGWTGIFGMGTRREARRRGAATAVLHTLARWAVEQDSARLYLQVEEDNAAARALYSRAGFVDAYHYHYRTRPI